MNKRYLIGRADPTVPNRFLIGIGVSFYIDSFNTLWYFTLLNVPIWDKWMMKNYQRSALLILFNNVGIIPWIFFLFLFFGVFVHIIVELKPFPTDKWNKNDRHGCDLIHNHRWILKLMSHSYYWYMKYWNSLCSFLGNFESNHLCLLP